MLEVNLKWGMVYRNFKLDFPLIENRAVDWWPIGRQEIAIVLNDGCKMVYDDSKSTIRSVGNTLGDDEEEWRRYFARKLDELMRINLVSSKDLAEYVGVSVQMVSRYLNMKSTPSPFVIQKIARMLNTTVTELTEFPDVD